jgi:copper chaperone CopZ
MSTVFDVKEMSCQNCVKHVTKAVQGVEPGAQVQVELSTGKVTVTPSPANPAAIAKAIEAAGYPAKVAG